MKALLTSLWCIPVFISVAQPTTNVSPHLLDQGIAITSFDFASDPSDSLPFEDVRQLNWAPFTLGDTLSMKPWEREWLRFDLQNVSTDTFSALLVMPYVQWISVWSEYEGNFSEQRAGGFVNYDERPFRPYSRAVPDTIPPGARKTYWVGLATYESKRLDTVRIMLKKPEVIFSELRQNRASLPIHAGHYMAIFTLLCVVFSILYFTTRDKATGWYALYVWTFFLLYLRKYEWRPGEAFLLSRYGEWYLHMEIILNLLTFIAYAGFVRHFLEIGIKNPPLDRFLKRVMIVLGIFIPIELVLMFAFGIREGFELFSLLRVLGFGAFGFALFLRIGKLRSKYAWFVLVGMCLLLAPALFTMFQQFVEGKATEPINDVCRCHETVLGKYCMYSMKLGIVLELLCFSFAIGYKLRFEKEMKHETAVNFQAVQEQFHVTEQALKQQEYLNKILLHEKAEKQPSKFLIDVMAAIESNAANSLFGVEQLADHVHISRAQLHRKITEETNHTPSQLMLLIRLRKAVELLKTTRLTIAEIAAKTGFSEAGYFAKVFKKEVGCTPSEARTGVSG